MKFAGLASKKTKLPLQDLINVYFIPNISFEYVKSVFFRYAVYSSAIYNIDVDSTIHMYLFKNSVGKLPKY